MQCELSDSPRIPLPTPSGPPEGELPVGQEKPPWGVSPGEGIFPPLPLRAQKIFLQPCFIFPAKTVL